MISFEYRIFDKPGLLLPLQDVPYNNYPRPCTRKRTGNFPGNTLCGFALDTLERVSSGLAFYVILGKRVNDEMDFMKR